MNTVSIDIPRNNKSFEKFPHELLVPIETDKNATTIFFTYVKVCSFFHYLYFRMETDPELYYEEYQDFNRKKLIWNLKNEEKYTINLLKTSDR